jgi:2-phospho-L-lactate guanylyltransferase
MNRFLDEINVLRYFKEPMVTLIPVKPFHQAKTRLAGVLSLKERIDLSRYLLQRTIQLAAQVGQVVVISRDAQVRRLAKQWGAWALVESNQGLNEALQQGVEWVMARQGQAVLILPSDLPLLQPADLQEMLLLGQPKPALVVAPCHRLDGTNAMLLHPPNLIPCTFGPGSFQRHCQAAQRVGVEPILYQSSTVALDIDIPADLERWQPTLQLERLSNP